MMIKSSKDTKDLIFYEKKKIGDAVVEFLRNGNEICLASKLKINGINTNMFKLGISMDQDIEEAPPTGCGNRVFVPNYDLPERVLEEYKISRKDMNSVLKYLEEKLSIGKCKFCS